LNPVTGNLASVTNAESIKQSIRNLILTPRAARYKQPLVGSKVATMLFDLWTPETQDLLITTAQDCIRICEPRAKDVKIEVEGHPELNYVVMHVTFTPINLPEIVSFAVVLRRAR
jgi:phage baseplate assembly protein W